MKIKRDAKKPNLVENKDNNMRTVTEACVQFNDAMQLASRERYISRQLTQHRRELDKEPVVETERPPPYFIALPAHSVAQNEITGQETGEPRERKRERRKTKRRYCRL